MSSNNQAFVKAYSRRNRSAGHPPAVPSKSSQPNQGGVQIDAPPQITRIDQPQAATPSPQSPTSDEADRIAARLGQYQRAAAIHQDQAVFGDTQIDSPDVSSTTAIPVGDNVGQSLGGFPGQTPSERFDHQVSSPPSPHHKLGQSDETVNSKPREIQSFQAVWEVDVFDVPGSVADLFFDTKRYQQISERMSAAVSTGLQSVLITSNQAGEGRSSVAIGIAMAAAASGIRVALVDADIEDPTLAEELRLDLQYGWVDTVRGGLPIKEIAVHAVEDGVTLVPLMAPQGQTAATPYEVTQLIESLQNSFDLILIDGPSALSSSIQQIAMAVDSAILVRDVTRTDQSMVNQLSDQLYRAGIRGVGVVENFV